MSHRNIQQKRKHKHSSEIKNQEGLYPSSQLKKHKRENKLTIKNAKGVKGVQRKNITDDRTTKARTPIRSLTSLASQLKRQRGTASSTPLPPEYICDSSGVLTDRRSNDFQKCLRQCYRGFYCEDAEEIPQHIHTYFSSAFNAFNEAGLFLYDAVQPGGNRLSRTFVTRTLVGDPGSTYRYLGLRLFSHPWCDVDENGDSLTKVDQSKVGSSLVKLGYTPLCAEALIKTGNVNQHLVERTKRALQNEISPYVKNGPVGSAEYSITLINRMEPTSIKRYQKEEAVNWHKDSGLQDFSSIAVYHTLNDYATSEKDSIDIDHYKKNDLSKMQAFSRHKSSHHSSDVDVPWRIALRVADSQSKTPALAVDLPSGSIYYMLDDLNHQHEHAVLAGSNSLRFSSTHRVGRTGNGTWQYIRDRCKLVLKSSLSDNINNMVEYNTSAKKKQMVKDVQMFQQLLTELEFEWIRQWVIQGKHHKKLHPYWEKPMKFLVQTFSLLHSWNKKIKDAMEESILTKRKSPTSIAMSEDLFDVFIQNLEEQEKLREAWDKKLKDPVFNTMPDKMKPFDISILDQLDINSYKLRKWRNEFVVIVRGEKLKKKNKTGRAFMTKKEQKRLSSNWEKMKTCMSKK